MPQIPKTKWELAPEGTHPARCIGFLDLGTHSQTFKDKTEDKRLCRIYWHLIGLKTKTGANVVIFQKYTYSPSANGNLMKILRSWLNVKDSKFDLAELIGKPAQVKVEHSENGDFANVVAVMECPKALKVKESDEDTHLLFLTPEDFDINEFNELPENTQGFIMDSPEYLECVANKGSKKKAIAKTEPAKGKKK